MQRTNLGKLLYAIRIERKYNNLALYLKDYNLPISESYYRDLESGRKVLRVETAKQLCDHLDIDQKIFFYHLLKDLIPVDVFKGLVKTPEKIAFDSVSDELDQQAQEIERLRESYKNRLLEDSFVVDNSVVEYLNINFEVLPLVHFIYMRKESSFKDIKLIISQNKIRKNFNQIITEFVYFKLAVIDKEKQTIKRHKRIFKIPPTVEGKEFKDLFFLHESKMSTQHHDREDIVDTNNTFIYSTIISMNPEKGGKRIKRNIIDLLSAVESLEPEESDLLSNGVIPFYLSIVVSPRQMYDTKEEQ